MQTEFEWERAFALMNDIHTEMARCSLPPYAQTIWERLGDYIRQFDIKDGKPILK